MNSRKVNWIFLTIILVQFVAEALLLFMGGRIRLTYTAVLLLSELLVAVPAALIVFFSKTKWNEALGFHRIKISSFFMILLFTFLCMPLVTVVNALSMLFADNAVMAVQGRLLQFPFGKLLVLMGVYGPFLEEFVFRGILYRGYKKSGSVFWAIILSSILFGITHLNVNQALYAFVFGIFLALMVEATGSLWGSVFCHMTFNAWQVCLMSFSQWLLNTSYGKMMTETAAAEVAPRDFLPAIGIFLMIAAFTTPLAVCVLAWIAKNEGHEKDLRGIWRLRKEKREYMVSIPLVLAIVISLAYMSLEFVLN